MATAARVEVEGGGAEMSAQAVKAKMPSSAKIRIRERKAQSFGAGKAERRNFTTLYSGTLFLPTGSNRILT